MLKYDKDPEVCGYRATQEYLATVLPDMGPMFKWGTALIAGGGTAGVVQGATVATRALSTATTGGVANPVVSTGENGSAVVMSVLAIVIPIVVAILVLVVLIWAIRRIIRWRRNRRETMAPDEPTPAV